MNNSSSNTPSPANSGVGGGDRRTHTLTLSLSKKEKGRLKKLHSKSSCTTKNMTKNGSCSAAVTGLQSNNEAYEYTSLCEKKKTKMMMKIMSKSGKEKDPGISTGISMGERGKKNANTTCPKDDDHKDDDEFTPHGPCIRFRKPKKNESGAIPTPRMTEGDDHRNLLHGILFHTDSNTEMDGSSKKQSSKKQNKKRRRNDDGDDQNNYNHEGRLMSNKQEVKTTINKGDIHHIPSWANLHNPALIQNLVVIEFQIQTKNNTNDGNEETVDTKSREEPILANSKFLSQIHCNQKNVGQNTNNLLPRGIYTKMRLFQDSHHVNTTNEDRSPTNTYKKKQQHAQRPKDITGVLMYSERKQKKVFRQEENLNENDDKDISKAGHVDKKQKYNYQKFDKANHIDDIFAMLEDVVLSEKDMIQEGYPLLRDFDKKGEQSKTQNIDQGTKNNHNQSDVDSNTQNSHCGSGDITMNDRISYVNERIHEYIANQIELIGNTEGKESSIDFLKRVQLEDFTSSIFTSDEAERIIKSLHQTYICQKDSEEKVLLSHKNRKGCENIIDERIYVSTFLRRQDQNSSSSSPRVYALDCEMVKTKIGSELARVSLVQLVPTKDYPERCIILLDSYVKPKNYILDYLTEFSGITPSLLYGKTKTLEQIQTILVSLICKEDILVGHSLENDLRVLYLIHEKVVDTALLFRIHHNSCKFSLRHLSLCLLQKRIQEGTDGKVGHNSVEDAITTLILAVRRVRRGEEKFRMYDKRNDKENLMEVLTKVKRKDITKQPLFFRRNQGPMICLGPNDWIKEHVGGRHQSAMNILQCENINSSSIKAIASYLRPGSRNASFLWAKLSLQSGKQEEVEKVDTLLFKKAMIKQRVFINKEI